MKHFIFFTFILFVATVAQAEDKREVRFIKTISLNSSNYFAFIDFKIAKTQNAQGFCQLHVKSENEKEFTIEADTLAIIESVEYFDNVDQSIPFGNKFVTTVVKLSLENSNLQSKIICNSSPSYTVSNARKNKTKIDEIITAFSDILN